VTDKGGEADAEWVPVLRDFARACGHELRNALNGLVVNLEVVKSRSDSLDAFAQPFLAQAIDQAEESARLAESTISLLNLVVGAVGEDGGLRARYAGPRAVEIQVSEAEAARALRNLQALEKRTALAADVSGGTVILSIPERTPDSN
jgi:hypothetical protein